MSGPRLKLILAWCGGLALLAVMLLELWAAWTRTALPTAVHILLGAGFIGLVCCTELYFYRDRRRQSTQTP